MPGPQSKWNLKMEDVGDALLKSSTNSCGGIAAASNKVITWTIKHNAIFEFKEAMARLAKAMTQSAMTGCPRKIFRSSKGLPIGKADKSKPQPRPDDDVRPITICDAFLRIIDRLQWEDMPANVRERVMGHIKW